MPTFSEYLFKSLENQMRKNLIRAIRKDNDTDIILLHKPGGNLINKHYYTRKNQYFINFCVV